MTYRLTAGVEHDLAYHGDRFTVLGSFGSTSYTGPEPRQSRPTGSAGISYEMAPFTMVSVDGYVGQSSFRDTPDYGFLLGFKRGF